LPYLGGLASVKRWACSTMACWFIGGAVPLVVH
jgi:hypothetical protein